jgi:hypothetical protein
MRNTVRQTILFAGFAALLMGLFPVRALASDVKTYRGKFSDGAKYLIQVPSKWNGTLLLYSHDHSSLQRSR